MLLAVVLSTLAVTILSPLSTVMGADLAIDDKIAAEINTAVTFDVMTNDAPSLSFVEHTPVDHGRLSSDGDGGFEYLPHANFLGTDGFSYTVEDGDGARSSASVAIEVTGEVTAVEARSDRAATDEDSDVSVSVRDNDGAGPDNLPLTVAIEAPPEYGNAALQADGSFVYTPAANWSGEAEFRYSITDGVTTDTARVVIEVAPVADLPIASDDAILTDQGQSVEIEILANDSDADGDPIELVEHTPALAGSVDWSESDRMMTYEPNPDFFGSDSFTYSIADGDGADTGTVTVTVDGRPIAADDAATAISGASAMIAVLANDGDPEAQPLSVTSVTRPDHGEASISPDFSIRYVSDATFTGTDTFTYTVADTRGNPASATVTVDVAQVGNLAPNARDDEYILDEDSPGNTLDVLTNDSDPDGGSLTIAIDRSPEFGDVIVGANQVVIYTPDPDFSGADSFAYSVSDGSAGADAATVTVIVQPVNDLPVAATDAFTIDEDAETVLEVVANDTDLDGGNLVVESVESPQFGTATVTDIGGLVYQPDNNYSGQDAFSYTLSDGSGGTATALISITVVAVNDPPRSRDDQAATDIGKPVDIPVFANDSDADHADFGIAIETGPEDGVAVVAVGNVIRYQPNPAFEGVDRFTYLAVDAAGATDAATVIVIVGNPDLDPIATKDDARTTAGEPVSIKVLANDRSPIDARLTVTEASAPEHGSVEISKGKTIVYTPDNDFAGKDSFTYTVTDADGRTDTVRVYINVRPVDE